MGELGDLRRQGGLPVWGVWEVWEVCRVWKIWGVGGSLAGQGALGGVQHRPQVLRPQQVHVGLLPEFPRDFFINF